MMFQTLKNLMSMKDKEGLINTQNDLNQTMIQTNMNRLVKWMTLLKIQLRLIKSSDSMR